MKKIIVVSAVNLVEGGTLSVLQECLGYLSNNLADEYEIIVLVNKKSLFNFKDLKYLEFPIAKRNWLNRLYYEYHYFYKLSERIDPFLWFSFHDISPKVRTERLAVYCHNPSPFPPLVLNDLLWGGYKYILFKLLYRYLYAINIEKTNFVIIQQDCLRKKFDKLTGFKAVNIIVSHPAVNTKTAGIRICENGNIFFYPSLPRVFKNFEIIGHAAKLLLKQGVNDFQVIFTISGKENRYAQHIRRLFKNIEKILFLGLQSREQVFELYNKARCVIFPSKMETWGMPITETKNFQKPILLADLEYAHETLGSYDKVKFFHPNKPEELAEVMKAVINKTIVYENVKAGIIDEPFTQTWEDLFNTLLHSKLDVPLKYQLKARKPVNV